MPKSQSRRLLCGLHGLRLRKLQQVPWLVVGRKISSSRIEEKCKMLLARANLHSVFGALPPPAPPPPPITSSISDGSPPHIPAKEAALPDQIPDYGGVFRASVLEEEAAQKYLPTRGARERGISCIYTAARPRPPAHASSFRFLPLKEDDDPMIGGAAEVVANRADPTDRPIEVDEM